MNKYLFISQFLFFIFACLLSSREIKAKNYSVADDSSKIVPKVNQHLLAEGGINFSSFQTMSSLIKPGYSLGLTFNYDITDKIGLSVSTFIAKENTYINNIKSIYKRDNICYREYYDFEASFLFLEFPVSLYYKFWENESSAIYLNIGYGYSLAYMDYSERTNFELTDEIVIPYPCDYYPQGDYYSKEDTMGKSGWSINAAVWIIYKKAIFKLLYINKRYAIPGFDNLHTLSVHIGYHIN